MKSRSALRTVKILDLISQHSEGLTLSEIALESGIPVASTNDIIKALLEEEMVEIIDHRSKAYGIGVKAFAIGNRFIANTSLVDKARRPMAELSQTSDRTVFLAKEYHGKITYIHKHSQDQPNTLIATCSIGSQREMYNTSLGKCFLAYQDGLLEQLKDKQFEKTTAWTITSYPALQKEVEKVRIQGYAVDNREQNENLLCVGAPIFDHSEKIVASISMSGIYREDINIDKLGSMIRKTALEISSAIGYRGK